MKYKVMLLVLLASTMLVKAQPEKFDNILYGVAFYEEYMPSDRLDKDVQMMKEAGISVVRLCESSWSLFEPREGEFEFAWTGLLKAKVSADG
jgi:beta-galactosidase